MKIYALKDILIDYWLTPFAAQDDKPVMAAISATINSGGLNDAIVQAPHQFQLWKIGEVNEDGSITASQELICGCQQLVREGVRNNQSSPAGDHPGERAVKPSQRAPERTSGEPGAYHRPATNGLQAAPPAGGEAYRDAGGVPEGPAEEVNRYHQASGR